MLVPRNRLLVRILFFISFFALSCIVVAYVKQNGGYLKLTEEAAYAQEVAQEKGHDVTTVASVTTAGSHGARSASFRANVTKSVLIVAYQRTGSSLFGRMFNSNHDNVFYLFEPLDAIYCAMYGTMTGWNVPSDITHYANGSSRTVPKRELTAVSESMLGMFSCDINRLPTQLLFSPFFRGLADESSTLGEYISCLDRFKLTEDTCQSPKTQIERFCGQRFGESSEETLTKCYQFMWNGKLDVENVSSQIRQNFKDYRTCMEQLRVDTESNNCSRIFRDACTRNTVRVIKSVRATMESVEPLLRRLPNLRVIHLIRDPRGVVVSRKNFHESVRGRFSEGATDELAREAQVYCETVVQDIRTRVRLETSFPGRIRAVVYDEYVLDMVGYVRDIYRFLDMDVPKSTLSWVRSAAVVEGGRNATDLATAWRDVVTIRTNEEIVRRCQELFSLVGAKWPV